MSRLKNDPLAQSLGVTRVAPRATVGHSVPTMPTPELRQAILETVRGEPGGLNAERIAAQLGGLDPATIRRRVSELHGRGFLRKTTKRAPTKTGRTEIIWEIA